MRVDVRSSDFYLIEIYNLTGKRIMTKEVYQGTTNIDLTNLPKGMYVVVFKGTGVPVAKKVIKK